MNGTTCSTANHSSRFSLLFKQTSPRRPPCRGEGGLGRSRSTHAFPSCAAQPCPCPCSGCRRSPHVAYISFHSFIELDHLFPWEHSSLSSVQEDFFVSLCVSFLLPLPSPLLHLHPYIGSSGSLLHAPHFFSHCCPFIFFSFEFSENPMSWFSDFVSVLPSNVKAFMEDFGLEILFHPQDFLYSQIISSFQLPVFVLSMQCLSNITENTQ